MTYYVLGTAGPGGRPLFRRSKVNTRTDRTNRRDTDGVCNARTKHCREGGRAVPSLGLHV